MAKETSLSSLPAPELNAYVSSPSGPRAKETTFREWVVDNQIGMESTHCLNRQFFYSAGVQHTDFTMALACYAAVSIGFLEKTPR